MCGRYPPRRLPSRALARAGRPLRGVDPARARATAAASVLAVVPRSAPPALRPLPLLRYMSRRWRHALEGADVAAGALRAGDAALVVLRAAVGGAGVDRGAVG